MPEEIIDEAPVETTDQPTVEETPSTEVESFTELDPNEAPEGGHTPEWLQERHRAFQGDYTRKTQELADLRKAHQDDLSFMEALRSDPDTQRAVFEQLQELIDAAAETEETPQAEADPRDTRIAALEKSEQERSALSLASNLKSHIDQLAADSKLELDDTDFEDIFRAATTGEQINPEGTAKAFKAWHDRQKAVEDRAIARYLKSKEAPEQLPPGTAATDTYDFNDEGERQRRMAAILEAK